MNAYDGFWLWAVDGFGAFFGCLVLHREMKSEVHLTSKEGFLCPPLEAQPAKSTHLLCFFVKSVRMTSCVLWGLKSCFVHIVT